MNTTHGFSWLVYVSLVLLPAILIGSMMWRWWSQSIRSHHPYGLNEPLLRVQPYPPGPHTGRGSKHYRRSDERIIEEIHDRLLIHGFINAEDIEVESEDGVVTLKGSVENRRASRHVEDVVDSVAGVAGVNNRLTLESDRMVHRLQQKAPEDLRPEQKLRKTS